VPSSRHIQEVTVVLIALLLVIVFVPILTLIIEHLVLHAAARCRKADPKRTDDRARRSHDDR
jgi:hypothetical protein